MDLSEVRGSEARHPWETARAVAIERILRAAQVRPRYVLDYGCGDGFTGEHVLSVTGASSLTGFDLHLSNEQCAAHSKDRIEYTNDWARVVDRSFDLCLMCDVIEHVADDRALLAQAHRLLSAEGFALITVPAFQSLFTSHDRALRHFRRYSLGQLEQVAKLSAFDLIGSGYLFCSLLPGRGAGKLIESVKQRREEDDFGIGAWSGSKRTTRLIETVLNWDNSVLLGLASRGIKLPGLSAWALCKKHPS
jgi:SAM-dependent methyltransferase